MRFFDKPTTSTGDPAWEWKAFAEPYGFSRHGRYYEPGVTMEDEYGMESGAPAAFTEDMTFLFAGLPALQVRPGGVC